MKHRIDYFAVSPPPNVEVHCMRGEPGEDVTLDNGKGEAPLPEGWLRLQGDMWPERILVEVPGRLARLQARLRGSRIRDRRPWAEQGAG